MSSVSSVPCINQEFHSEQKQPAPSDTHFTHTHKVLWNTHIDQEFDGLKYHYKKKKKSRGKNHNCLNFKWSSSSNPIINKSTLIYTALEHSQRLPKAFGMIRGKATGGATGGQDKNTLSWKETWSRSRPQRSEVIWHFTSWGENKIQRRDWDLKLNSFAYHSKLALLHWFVRKTMW